MKNDLINELSTNFIEYAAAVNSDRAIPNAIDGLKPVAKRILYGAFASGRTSSKPHVKCAKIVGDVMGSYHPHGDSSIYGALVRLAQNWVMRYPLIDFHGNVGNQSGDGPAASRYTEARLAKITEEGMLQGIKKNNVDFIPNYDETTEEPVCLPSVFPNLLCNPNSGIGVAMACSWAPHNLTDVAVAIYAYLEGMEPTLPGPDFPTGGIIINSKDIPAIMKTGHGSVKIRSRYTIEKQKIIITEIPYGISIESLMTEIGELSDSKEIEGIDNIRDESNKNGIRIVIDCDYSANPNNIINILFNKTNLQSSFSYNQVALVNKVPTELNLKDCIKIYVDHNINCIVRETKFDLNKVTNRLEIVEGLLKALEDIDNIISLIKKSENASMAKQKLIDKYNFTENQAKAILAMRLSSLAKLEAIELNKEAEELNEQIQELNNILANEGKQKAILKSRLNNLVKLHGDKRRTELTNIEIPKEEKEKENIIAEDVIVLLSQNGDIKRIPKSSFKVQGKNTKGIKNKDDILISTIATNTIDYLLLFTQKGKVFKLLVNEIIAGTNVSKGISIGNLIKIDSDDAVIAITSLEKSKNTKYVVFFTKKGLMKKTKIEEYSDFKKSCGIAAIKLIDGDSIANVEFMNEENVLIITKNGMSIHFETKNVNPIGRITSGVKTIKLDENDEVVCGLPIKNPKKDLIAIFSTQGYGKQVSITDFVLQNRAGKGLICKPSDSYGEIADAFIVDEEKKNILISGKPNSICIALSELPILSRTAFGNIMIKSSNIISVTKF